VIWKRSLYGPRLFHHGRLLTTADNPLGLAVVNPDTGDVERVIPCPAISEMAVIDDVVVGSSVHAIDAREAVCGVAFGDGKRLWTWPPRGTATVNSVFCADSTAVYFGLSDSAVVALDLRTGEERWRHDHSDLTHMDFTTERPSVVRGVTVVFGAYVLCELFQNWVMGVSAADGRRLWHRSCAARETYFYVDRYYVFTGNELLGLDPATGAVLSEVNLRRKVPKKLAGVTPAPPLLISETHVWLGSLEGYVLAYDRQTGECVWGYRPKGGAMTDFTGNYFASANGWLYYGDMSYRVYGLREDPGEGRGRAKPVAKRVETKVVDEEEGGEPEGLSFEILKVLKGRELTEAPPYHRLGGDWTVLQCRVEGRGGAEFYVAGELDFGGLFDWGQGAVWVPSVKDGQALLAAMKAAFRPGEPEEDDFPADDDLVPIELPNVAKARGVTGPQMWGVAVFEEETRGGWTWMKWSTEEGLEFLMLLNPKMKRGLIVEKERVFRDGLLQAFASLLVV
jgi:outer membrane protein assembly factor BamB